MVVFLRRLGGQLQFSATLEAQTRESRPLGDLLGWLPDHLRHELSVEELARRAAMSPRNFARLFRQELGKTPGTSRISAWKPRDVSWNRRHEPWSKSLMRAG
jgi:transcriptional regulator GlxA family with amidase domain